MCPDGAVDSLLVRAAGAVRRDRRREDAGGPRDRRAEVVHRACLPSFVGRWGADFGLSRARSRASIPLATSRWGPRRSAHSVLFAFRTSRLTKRLSRRPLNPVLGECVSRLPLFVQTC